jgi:hypothetical protein
MEALAPVALIEFVPQSMKRKQKWQGQDKSGGSASWLPPVRIELSKDKNIHMMREYEIELTYPKLGNLYQTVQKAANLDGIPAVIKIDYPI